MGITCPDCGEKSVGEDWKTGHTVCRNCAYVLPGRLVDPGEEKRNFSANHTTIGASSNNRSSAFDSYTGDSTVTLVGDGASKLLQVQNQQAEYKHSKVQEGINRINYICSLHSLGLTPTVKQASKHLWVKFENNRKKYSRTADDSMYAAVIYEACRQEGQRKNYQDFAEIVKTDIKTIRKAHKRLLEVLHEEDGAISAKLNINTRDIDRSNSPLLGSPLSPSSDSESGTPCSISPETAPPRINTPAPVEDQMVDLVVEQVSQLIFRYSQRLRLDQQLVQKSTRLAPRAVELLEGRRPVSVAAAILLFASKYAGSADAAPVPDKDIARVAKVANGTMRSAYRILEQNSQSLIACVN